VLSPNGDGVADSETFSYRVARPSQVVAVLDGPGGARITLANGQESRGLHTLTWNGLAGGAPAAEGKWTLTVAGTDDRNVTTRAERTFLLDDTLSSLAVTIGSHRRLTGSFRLARAAKILVQIQRPNGVAVATLRSGQRAAGPVNVSWRGRIGRRRAPSGRYQVAVQATSAVGTSSLVAPFSYRAHKRH
jgi:flagellar hook assembly protein FlgD